MTDIQMTGIDHSTAGVKIREQFSFTVLQAERALQKISSQKGVHGCVLLSTCNRMELYASMEAGSVSLLDLFNKAGLFSGLEDPYDTYFKIRRQEEAVRHLFYLTAGLKSRILGEDQILTQVREAVKQSRELYCTDPVLEVLFRQAVTAGKEVKTKVMSGYADMSAVHCALAYIRQKGFTPEGKKCLVIGNGKMGKLAAETLRNAGASVTVTVRQYKSGMVEIPKGCERIHYGERYEIIPSCDLIVSATVSPNLTIRKDALAQAMEGSVREQIYIDLAVPRDMEEEIAQLPGVTLYDIDRFQNDRTAEEFLAQKQAAEQILEQRIKEFQSWYECRDLIPKIQQIGHLAAEEICWRTRRGMERLPQEDQEKIRDTVNESARKVVDKMLYALRDELSGEQLQQCLKLLERIRYSE